MRVFDRLWGAAIAVVIVLGGLGSPLQAMDLASDLKRKINVAGAQRMLSQRMAKSACFRSMGIGGADHAADLDVSRTRFATALAGLRDGNVEMGMQPETNGDVLAALDDVAGRWGEYQTALENAHEDRDSLIIVASRSLPVLKSANDVVLALEASNTDQGLGADLARLVNVAGRQRMLTQKAAKEFCLIAADIDAEAQRMALAGTVALFDRSLTALIEGDPEQGLIGAPDDVIYLQLEHIQDIWAPLRAQFQRVIDGGKPGSTSLFMVSANIDSVLKASNEAVWLYENF